MDAFPEPTVVDAAPVFPPPRLADAAAQIAYTIPVVLDEPPRKRRAGRLVAAGLVVVAALVGTGFVVFEKQTADAAYSLTAASAAAAETKAVAFTMTIGVMGKEVTAEAETDSESGISHIVMDLGVVGVDSSLEMIADTRGKAIYFKSSFLADSGLPIDTDWVKMDEAFLQEQTGSVSIFDSANIGNPLDAATLFDNAKSVNEIGFDEVDGVKVKHFEVVVDALDALKVTPQLQRQFDALDTEVPTDLTYDVYVDEQNQIRRTTAEISLAGQTVAVDVVIKPLTEPLVIELPDPADVTDFAGLI